MCLRKKKWIKKRVSKRSGEASLRRSHQFRDLGQTQRPAVMVSLHACEFSLSSYSSWKWTRQSPCLWRPHGAVGETQRQNKCTPNCHPNPNGKSPWKFLKSDLQPWPWLKNWILPPDLLETTFWAQEIWCGKEQWPGKAWHVYEWCLHPTEITLMAWKHLIVPCLPLARMHILQQQTYSFWIIILWHSVLDEE